MNKTATIMGIDFGIANTIFLAFNNNNHYYSIRSAPVLNDSRKLIKSRDNPYEIIDTYNHKTALFVINMAIKHHVSVIQMEDLSGTDFTDNMFYFDLQRSIQSLGEERNIIIKYVDRYLTSQRCSVCGYIDKKNRLTQSTFICLKCGNTMNADYNASKNISNPDILKK